MSTATIPASPLELTSRVINVASVPQRSPFRYPGGKTWLVPYVRLWLKSKSELPSKLLEPFAGGGIIGLTAAFEELARKIVLVELDSDVACVWKTILSKENRWLAARIEEFQLKPDSVRKVLSRKWRANRDRAFATILRNRVQRGGIMAAGAGLMKNGENGRGLASRWYPETLSRRILDIGAIRKRITFHKTDGLKIIKRNLKRPCVAFFIDPPYTVAGRRLYRHSDINHRELFALMCRSDGDFLMTYDDSEEIRKLVVEFRLDCETVAMKNTHNSRMDELLIGRSLKWLRRPVFSLEACREFSLQIRPD